MTYTDPNPPPSTRRHRWALTPIKLGIALSVVILLGTLAAILVSRSSNDTTPSPVSNLAACKVAMQRQFTQAMANPNGPTATRPPECVGVSDADVEKIANDLLSSAFGDASLAAFHMPARAVSHGSIRSADLRLARLHACHPMTDPIRPPVAGYVISLHSNPAAPWFYRSVDALTSGLFYGDGGDWVLREWCSR